MSTPLFFDWHHEPPAHWQQLQTLDMHTGGEPLRVITAGLPELPGASVLDKRRYFSRELDHLRRALMWEPRGHADMYGAVLTRSQSADFDVFFLHNEGYSTMCGHAIIALTKLVLETGLHRGAPDAQGLHRISFQVPAGRVEASARLVDGLAQQISFVNVPSFVYLAGQRVEVEGLGAVRFDIAYGGAFYALVEAAPLGLQLLPEQQSRLIDAGRRIKQAVMAALTIRHPFEPELGFLYGTIFTGPAQHPAHHSRNVCIFADGEVDRSPTGSGVSARAALHHARGELALGETLCIESILGSLMTVRVAATETFGPHAAVRPEVGGSAHYTGRHRFYLDPDDPQGAGFLLR
ncbi:proline racemase family protein [Paucibacter soli]|uniref:proline racemase family protein n=1 Tax=Paucibacter soli TaxID=3133433 RepID=UPI0030A85DE0